MTATRESILATLKTRLLEIKDDRDYPLTFDFVVRGPLVNALTSSRFPLVSIEDRGPEVILDRDQLGTRYATDVDLVLYVKASAELEEKLNNGIAALRQFINSSPDLGTRALSFFDLDMAERGVMPEKDLGWALIGARLVYYDPHLSTTSPSGTEVAGNGWLPTLYSWLETQLSELQATLASGYAYKFDQVYNRHNVANLQVPAVAFQLVRAVPMEEDLEEFGVDSTDVDLAHSAAFSIRILTAYQGARFDAYGAAAIGNSIANKLVAQAGDANVDVVSIEELTTGEAFEGATLGGSLLVTLRTFGRYTRD